VGSYRRQNVDADLRVDERTLREFVAARRTVLVRAKPFVRPAYAPGNQSQYAARLRVPDFACDDEY
jgi:hypothetical protein